MSVIHGDCIEVMAGMDPESVDAIVTDPPYGLEFMGKEWDKLGATVEVATEGADRSHPFRDGTRRVRYGSSATTMQAWHQQWAEAAYRVAKPSAYLLAFGGTRTVHRMTVALEDAGWIIRDMLVWAYASGFPKSKASLKPAWEPIVMARKPGPLRMLAIDECRIPTNGEVIESVYAGRKGGPDGKYGDSADYWSKVHDAGRWPANIILTDPIFDGGVEGVVGGGEASTGSGWAGAAPSATDLFTGVGGVARENYGDSGTYSRFFLIPKAARNDREPVLGGLPEQDDDVDGSFGLDAARPHTKPDYQYQRKPRTNVHPTVKPTDLMRHLVRLVTPTGGVVLDPFLGSGTTALAAEMEGFEWIGIERELEYVQIAEARLNGTQRGLGLETA